MARSTSVDSILKSIIQRTQDFVACSSVSTLSRSLVSQSPLCLRPIADIPLPDPPRIQHALMAAGALPGISLEIEQAYQKRAAELQALTHSTITHILSNQSQSNFRYVSEQKILSVFTELYLRQLSAWRASLVSCIENSSTSDKAQTSSCATKFNHVRRMSCLHSSSPS